MYMEYFPNCINSIRNSLATMYRVGLVVVDWVWLIKI